MKGLETVVLLAHGEPQPGAFSNPKIKTITPSGELLGSDQAQEYLSSPGRFPLRPSTSFGYLSGLDDVECEQLLGTVPMGPLERASPAFQDTAFRLGDRPDGPRVLVLRQTVPLAGLGIMAKSYSEVILLACRSLDAEPPEYVQGRNVSCPYLLGVA